MNLIHIQSIESFQIWNHFIHLPEEIQESFLEKYRKRDSNKSLKNGSKQSKIRST